MWIQLNSKQETMESVEEKKLFLKHFAVSWKLLIYRNRNNNAYPVHYKEIYNYSPVLDSGDDVQK